MQSHNVSVYTLLMSNIIDIRDHLSKWENVGAFLTENGEEIIVNGDMCKSTFKISVMIDGVAIELDAVSALTLSSLIDKYILRKIEADT